MEKLSTQPYKGTRDFYPREMVLRNWFFGKIRKTLEGIDREAFYSAVEKIVSARNIYILGVRSSAALADFLIFNFRNGKPLIHSVVNSRKP